MAFKGSTGTYGELLFAQNGAGTPYVGNAGAGTATLLSKQSTTYPLPVLDSGYFQPHYGVSKAVKVAARGIISFASAATPQTFSAFGLSFASSDTTTIGTNLCVSGTVTPVASQAVSNAIWELECDFNCLTAGSSGTMEALGLLTIAPATLTLGAAPVMNTIGLGAAAAITYNTEIAAYLQLGMIWTNANTSASNTVTCEQVFVYGQN